MAKSKGELSILVDTISGILEFWGCGDCGISNFAGLRNAKLNAVGESMDILVAFNSVCDKAIVMLTVMRDIGFATVINAVGAEMDKFPTVGTGKYK